MCALSLDDGYNLTSTGTKRTERWYWGSEQFSVAPHRLEDEPVLVLEEAGK
jgi:hypothetical protein